MAKRTIRECDLTKQEMTEDEEVVTITIKRDGKRSGRTYEVSSVSAAKLEQQLIAGSEAKLLADWTFSNAKLTRDLSTARKLEDFDSDEAFVAQKKAEVADREEPEIELEDLNVTNACRHINKGRIQTTLKNGKRFIYRKCLDCPVKIPEQTTEARNSYMNAQLPSDIKIKDLGERKK